MPEFRPVDYDPFGSDGSDGPALVPVDHDPFADDDEEVTLSAFPPVDLNAPVMRADPGPPVFMSVGDIGGVFDAPAPPPSDPQKKLALPLSENFYPDTELKPYGFLDRIKNVFRRNRRNAFYTGGSTGLAVNALSGGQAYTRPELEGFEMSSLTPASDDPIGAIADRLAAGTGQLVGSIPHVESFLGPAGLAERQVAKMAIEGPIKQRIAQEAIENSIMNTVTDPAIQAANIASGLQDDYNPAQTAAAPVLGAAVGTATGAGFGTAGVVRERAAERRLDREAKASAQEQMAGVLDKIFLPPPEKMSSLPMSDAEIAIARKKMEPRQTGPAKLTPDQEKSLDRDFSRRERKINQAPPPERTYGDTVFGQEERLAQTRDDLPGQRDAAGAFRMADRQRERLAEQPGTLDTQAAGRPEGVNPQEVFLDQDFPVQIIDRRIVPDSRGRGVDVARVRRYDPRTGQPEPDSVEYEVEMRNLRRRQYTINPRQATDFQARAKGPRTPETPRMPNQDVRLEAEQTYRATAPDNNEQFPGAGMGRSPFPEQPEGPSRYRTESDAEAWFRAEQERRARGERTRAEQESEARAQEQYKGQKSTNTPRGKGDGRNWDVDDFGFVVSNKGGPVIFGDQKMAAKWILKHGQKDTDQVFEIYNHPGGKGFTVKERGRTKAAEAEAPAGEKASSAPPGEPRQLEQPGGRKPDEPPDNRPEDEITEENQGPEVDEAADTLAASLAGRNSRFVSKLRKVIEKAKDAQPDKIAAEHKELTDGIEEAEIFLEELDAGRSPDSRQTPEVPAAGPRPGDDEFIPAFARKNAPKGPEIAETPQKVAPKAEKMQNVPESSPKNDKFTPTGNKSQQAAQAKAETDRRFNEAKKDPVAVWASQGNAAREKGVKDRGLSSRKPSGSLPSPADAFREGWDSRMSYGDRRPGGDPFKGSYQQNQAKGWRAAESWTKENPRPEGAETVDINAPRATSRGTDFKLRNDADVIEGVAKQFRKMPRSRFYSNPFLDPFLMGDLLSTAGRKTLQLLQSEVKNWKVEARRVEKTLGSARDARGFQNGLRQWAQMNSEVLRGLGKKYPGVKAFMQAHDALSTHPGSGRAIKEPFENAHQRKANHFSNRLANILGDHADDEKFMNALRDALTTGNARGGTETAMARNVAGLLREIHDYAKAAGIKMGKVERFFPRWLDAEKVVADQEGFVKAATRQYQSEGMSPDEAGKAAQALYMNYAAPDSLFMIPSTMGPDSTKGRSWGPSADTTMRDYLVTDPSQVLFSYIDGMTYRAEWARRFGDDNQVINDWLQSMSGKVSKEDINLFKDAILASTGRMRARLGTAGERALDALSLFGTMMNLKRVALTSIPEAINTGVMTGDALDGMGAFVESVGTFLGAGGKTEKDLRKFAEFIGAIGSAENEMMQLSRYGLDFGGAKARLRSRKFFLLNGLTRLTHKQRIRAVKYGRIFFEDLAESVLEGGKRADSALLALSDYGIAPADAPAFAKWLVKDNAGRPDVTALSSLSGNQNRAMGETYMGALTRFADQVIQNPKAVNKPYMAYHPRARGIYGLTSFYFSLEHNILHPAIRRLATSVKGRNPATGKQMDAGQRLALASSTLFPLLVTWAVTSAVFNAREQLTNKTQHEERSAATKALLSVGRPGWLGRLNQFTGLMDDMYFETEIPYMLLGPSISSPASDAGAIAQFFSNKNSPNTPAAERKALIGVYDLALAGLLYKLMPYAPVKGAAAVGAFGAMQTLGAPELRKKVGTDLAEELTGQEYKPRGTAQKQKKSAGSF